MKRKLIIGIFLITFFILGAGTLFFLKIYNKVQVKKPDRQSDFSTPTPTPDPLGVRNVLILGYGGPGHEGGTLTDTMILAHIVPRENRVVLISIPRDLWVPIKMKDGVEYYKVNHAFAIGLDNIRYPNKLPGYQGISGGANLAKESVSYITNLKIDYFVAVDFEGFKRIIESLGGVEVNIPYSFKDEYYPIKGKENDTCGKTDEEVEALTATMSGDLLTHEFKCRFETIEFEKGLQTLNAESALKFVRSRHSGENGGDFQRALRQQALLTAIKNKLIRISSIPKIISLINILSNYVQTDIDIRAALDLLSKQEKISDIEIQSVSLTTDNVLQESLSPDGQYILIPKGGEGNWGDVHQFIKENINPLLK